MKYITHATEVLQLHQKGRIKLRRHFGYKYIIHRFYSHQMCSALECIKTISQQTRDVDPMLAYCWLIVCDAGPALNKHRINVALIVTPEERSHR